MTNSNLCTRLCFCQTFDAEATCLDFVSKLFDVLLVKLLIEGVSTLA